MKYDPRLKKIDNNKMLWWISDWASDLGAETKSVIILSEWKNPP